MNSEKEIAQQLCIQLKKGKVAEAIFALSLAISKAKVLEKQDSQRAKSENSLTVFIQPNVV